jgi:hypothetical protein
MTVLFQLLDIGAVAVPRCALNSDELNTNEVDICSFDA